MSVVILKVPGSARSCDGLQTSFILTVVLGFYSARCPTVHMEVPTVRVDLIE